MKKEGSAISGLTISPPARPASPASVPAPTAMALPTLREALRRRLAATITAVVLALSSSAMSLLTPLLVRQIIIDIGTRRSPVPAAVLLALVTLAGGFSFAWSSFLLGRIGEYGIASLRRKVVDHVLRMRLYDARGVGTGDLVSRATVDAAQLRSISDVSVTALPASIVVVVVSLVVMGLLNWILLLIVLLTFGLASIAIRFFLRGVRRGTAAKQAALGVLGRRFTLALDSLAVIKAYRAESGIAGSIDDETMAAARAAIVADRAQAFIAPLMGLGQQIAIIGVLTGSGVLLAAGRLGPADFVAFLMYLFQLISPLTLVASAFGRIQLGLASVGRIDSVLGMPVEDTGPASEPAGVGGPDVLEFRGVTAGYEGTVVLRDISFTVPRRGLTALVGVSGAGKSTILSLVERFLLPYQGEILFHGCELSEWPLSALRARLAYVDQSITLLEGTIRDNLTIGCEEPISDDELLSALAEVDLSEVVDHLPNGLDTEVGGSTDLSGGQRQRLAIARAMLRPAEVVVLDEPTSQLDGINEQRLVQIMEHWQSDRAVVVVAHRLSTVRQAGQIVFIREGAVVAQGSHERLMATCAGYQELVGAQHSDHDYSVAPI